MSDQSQSMPGVAPSRALLVILGAAGLAGAAGVALAAVAAHRVESPSLATAATMLMIHAAAVIAVLAVATQFARSRWWVGVAGVMLAAAALFSGAISYQAFMGEPFIKGAAPVGGTILIVSWAAVALLGFREALRAR
ncbi:MAG TPA: DUF423 domain-containing protein [Hyphomicrobium sp.]|nr:DUF423 domain-containing protein [Hyphomicrobium sp.]